MPRRTLRKCEALPRTSFWRRSGVLAPPGAPNHPAIYYDRGNLPTNFSGVRAGLLRNLRGQVLMIYVLTQKNNQYNAAYGLIDGSTRLLPDGVTKNPNPTYVNNASGMVQVLDPSGNPVIIGRGSAGRVAAT